MIDPDKFLVARKGATMTCINGHPIGTLIEDLRTMDVSYGAKFSYIQPDPTGMLPPVNCTVCGVQWFGPPDGRQVRWIEEDGTRHE